jgi:hypothetical protein
MGKFQNGVMKMLGLDKYIKDEVSNRMTSTFDEYQLIEVRQDKKLKYRQVENQIWFRGDGSDLEKFYKQKRYPNEQPNNIFWRAVDNKTVKVHYPMASSISRHMSAILFGDDIKYTVDTGEESSSTEMTERLEKIFKSNNIRELLQKAAIIESYSGSLGMKVIIDPDFSDVPILQVYPAEQIDLNMKYGKVYEIIFNDDYKSGDRTFKLKSIYGKGYIHYELFDKNGQRVPLETIPETATLKDILLRGPDGKPLKLMLAGFKQNKVVNNEFPDTGYGESDYSGLYGIFNALDELISAWNDYYRNSKVITFVSEDFLKRNPISGEVLPLNKFDINDVILYDATTNNSKLQDIRRDIPEIDITPFKEGFKNLVETALQRAGLSPISFGLENVSIISSGETLNVREKTTLRTRMDKIHLWKEFLSHLMKLIFVFDSLQTLSPSMVDNVVIYDIQDEFDYKFMAEFAQYYLPSREEQIKLLAASLNSKLIDIETAVKELYKDEYTEEQIQEIAEKIKKENGIFEEVVAAQDPLNPVVEQEPEQMAEEEDEEEPEEDMTEEEENDEMEEE